MDSCGDWVYVPHRATMCDSQHFEDPLKFDAFRFANEKAGSSQVGVKSSNMVDATADWLVWDSGRILWYVTVFKFNP
jgi:hypothetical protein